MQLDDTLLYTPSNSVDFEDPAELKSIEESMFELLDQQDGIGLAANQINLDKRVFVIKYRSFKKAFYNPIILDSSKNCAILVEGCLSLPAVQIPVNRPKNIRVQYQDHTGHTYTEKFSGMIARIFQHELDHLNGITIIKRGLEL